MLFKSLLLALTAFVLCAHYTEAVTFFGSTNNNNDHVEKDVVRAYGRVKRMLEFCVKYKAHLSANMKASCDRIFELFVNLDEGDDNKQVPPAGADMPQQH